MMVKEKVQIFKAYCQVRISRYFPSVRGAVLLIVVPAFLIVPVYFLTVVKEIIVDQRFSPGIYYENRFAAVRQDLPAHASVNFVSDQQQIENGDFLYVRYALVPARMVKGLKPEHDLLVVQYLNTPGIPSFSGYQLSKDYGNGVMLFKRSTK
jgi:hypothetical protein